MVLRVSFVALFASLLSSCANPSGEEVLTVTCTGKCDGLSSIRAIYDDLRELDLTDLSARGTNLATDELNDALSTDFAGVVLLEPTVFGLAELAASEPLIEDLDALSSGLLARFGEGELSTVVNQTRRAHLAASGDDVFVESGFRLNAGFNHGFGISAGGFDDATVSLGINGAAEGRIITATSRDPGTNPQAILAGIRSARGFVVPRDLSEVRDMRPGEAFALRGEGTFGLNLGVGVPIVIADPGTITYSLVLSAALRAQITGALDVQLVRLDGDEVIVDVGTERSVVRSAMLALRDGWGVNGLAETHVTLGGFDVDLGRILDRALRRQLDERLNLVSAELERTGRASRISIIRMRFSLSADGAIEEALSQAMRGDVRLAQALSARGEPGVIVEFDLLRSGLSSVSHAGLELFGMRFFATTLREEGTVRIETPGGAQELLFDGLHREGGWFFSTNGYGRIALAGLRFDAAGRAVESDVNLFVQVLTGDSFMERDKQLDHIDALITAVAGEDALAAIEEHGNALQRYVESNCSPGGGPGDACREAILLDPEVLRMRSDGRAALENATAGLDTELRDVVLAAGDLRLAQQATVEPAASLVGPRTSIVLDFRMDDSSLGQVLVSGDGEALIEAVLRVLRAVDVRRDDSPADIAARRARIADDEAAALARMAETFDRLADTYERLSAVEHARIEGLGIIGGQAIAVDVPMSGDTIDYDAATARSVVQARSDAARDVFDALLQDARALDGARHELALGYALLAMMPTRSVDVRLDVDMDLSDRFAQGYDHYRAAGVEGFDVHGSGRGVALIGGGLFDVDALIDVE